jgi:molybdate transport system regulatory protein
MEEPMAISARNVWPATVDGLDKGPVSTEVRLRLDSGDEAVSMITTNSAERLGLADGSRVRVLVKASNVLLLTGDDARAGTSARNRLPGEVSAIEDGAVHAIVHLRSDNGTEITSSITRGSVERLGMKAGAAATALVKASDVLLLEE